MAAAVSCRIQRGVDLLIVVCNDYAELAGKHTASNFSMGNGVEILAQLPQNPRINLCRIYW